MQFQGKPPSGEGSPAMVSDITREYVRRGERILDIASIQRKKYREADILILRYYGECRRDGCGLQLGRSEARLVIIPFLAE